MPDDAQLLRDYAEKGSEAAFTALVERHSGLVYHAALRQAGGNAALAQDVTQTVFVTLARRARALSRHPSLAGWLHTCTHFTTARSLRAAARRAKREAVAQALTETTGESIAPAWERVRPSLDGALLELNRADREAVLLRYFEQCPITEMAARLHVTEAATYKRLERALDRLRAILGRRGITSSAGALAALLGAEASVGAPSGVTAAAVSAVLAGGGTPVAGVGTLQFITMGTSMIKLGTAAAILAISLAGGAAIWQGYASHRAKLAYISAHAETERLRGNFDTVQRGLRDKELASAQQSRGGAIAGLWGPPPQDGKAFLEKHPEVKAAWTARERSYVRQGYAPFFRLLGLTQEQIEKYQDIESQWIAMGTVGVFSLDFRNTALNWNQSIQAIRDLLGDDGLQAWYVYERMAPAREAVTQLSAALYFTSAPLTQAQAEQLTQVIAATIPPKVETGPGFEGMSWDAVLAKAPDFLSPRQLAALEDIHQSALYDQARTAAIGALPPQQ